MKTKYSKNLSSLFVMVAIIFMAIAAPAMAANKEVYDANNDGVIQKDEAIQAELDFFNGVTTKQDAISMVLLYFEVSSASSQSIAAASPGTVTRSFSTATVAPGETIIVTITPSPAETFDLPGYQVIETVPAGFMVTANTADMGTNIDNLWTFTNIGNHNFTYNVTAPAAAGTYIFSGTFKDENADTGVVAGSSIVTVGLPPEVAAYDTNNDGYIQKNEAIQALIDYFAGMIPKQTALAVEQSYFSTTIGIKSTGNVTRAFSAANVAPGESLTVTITPAPAGTFDLPGYQVIETVPAGFTVTPNTGWISSIVGNVYTFTNIGYFAFTYTVTAPAAAGIYTFSGTFKDENADTGVVTGSSIVTVGTVLIPGSISGYKINDTNGNGKWDEGEKGISNWPIRLIGINGKGKDAIVIRKETFTDTMGFYKFDDLPAGRYFVIEKLKKGFVHTSSPVKRIKLAQYENSMNNNFTNMPVHRMDKINGLDIDDYEAINRDIEKHKEDMDWN